MGMPTTLRGASSYSSLQMALKDGETPIVIGLAADSGCGKSTFMRRVTSTFGGDQCGPLGGGFGNGSWETNTLVSDMATVICLDDYHLNDREGRKVSGLTALNTAEQKFDLMFEHVQALKNGKSVMKPIYNHVNGTRIRRRRLSPLLSSSLRVSTPSSMRGFVNTNTQTHKHTNTQTHKHTNTQTHKHTNTTNTTNTQQHKQHKTNSFLFLSPM